MTKLNVAYVPDAMWTDFGRGIIHHFEYGDPISVAVYADERRVEFDSTVTEEMVAKEREASIERMRASGALVMGPFHATVSFEGKERRGVIYGWTK